MLDLRPSNGYPPRQYVKMQWVATGERFEEMLTNAHNCFDIVSSYGTLIKPKEKINE